MITRELTFVNRNLTRNIKNISIDVKCSKGVKMTGVCRHTPVIGIQ